MINLVLAIVTFALLVKLNEIIGLNIGFKVDKEHLKRARDTEESTIEEVSDQEKLLRKLSLMGVKFDLEDFLKKANQAFEIIFKAYAEEDKPTLKNLLSPKTYKAFSLAIDDRKNNKEILEGSILQFVETTLVDADITGDKIYLSVKFVTDQTIALKSAEGTVLEGSPDYVESHTDVWVFVRGVNSSDPRWLLHEIKSEN